MFLRWLEEYFEFFMTEVGGIPSTPLEIHQHALELTKSSFRLVGHSPTFLNDRSLNRRN
jgi:hypothetical protein